MGRLSEPPTVLRLPHSERAARQSAEKFPSAICRNGTPFMGLACRCVFLSIQHLLARVRPKIFFPFHPFHFFPFVCVCFFFRCCFFLVFCSKRAWKWHEKEKLNARKFLVVCSVLIIETHRISLNVHKYKILRTILGLQSTRKSQ